MNFTRELFAHAPRSGRALVELARDRARREWSFGALGAAAEARIVDFAADLPKTSSGKVRRSALRGSSSTA